MPSATRYARRVDANHREVVTALLAVGCSVFDASSVGRGFVDLVAGRQGRTYLIEIKRGASPSVRKDGYTRKGKAGVLMANQAEFAATWRGAPVIVVRSVDEALSALEVPHG